MSTTLLIRTSDAAVLRWQDDADFDINLNRTVTQDGEVIAIGAPAVHQIDTSEPLPGNMKPLAYTWADESFVVRPPDPDPLEDLPPEPQNIELDDGRTRVPVAKFQQVFLTRQETLRLELFALGEDEAGQPVDAAARHFALIVKGYFSANPYVNLERAEHQALIQEMADSGVLLGQWRVAQVLNAEMPTETDPNPE